MIQPRGRKPPCVSRRRYSCVLWRRRVAVGRRRRQVGEAQVRPNPGGDAGEGASAAPAVVHPGTGGLVCAARSGCPCATGRRHDHSPRTNREDQPRDRGVEPNTEHRIGSRESDGYATARRVCERRGCHGEHRGHDSGSRDCPREFACIDKADVVPEGKARERRGTSRRSIAVVVIGGQSLSLMLTLLVTPVAYSLFDDLRLRVAGLRSTESADMSHIA